jgi:hypothetical protein
MSVTRAPSRNDPAETAIATCMPEANARPAISVPSTATPIAPPACLAAFRAPEAIPAWSAGAFSITAAVAAGIVNAIPKPATISGATKNPVGMFRP